MQTLDTKTYSLADQAMTVALHIGTYSGRRYDKKTARELEQSKGAEAHRYSVSKVLLKCKELDAINTEIGRARKTHVQLTVPWGEAHRALYMPKYFDYVKEMNGHKRIIMDDLVPPYLDIYSEICEQNKIALGSGTDDSEFPSLYKMKKKFYFTVVPGQIQDEGDFRSQRIPIEEVKIINDDYNAYKDEALKEAVKEPYRRVLLVLNDLLDRVKDYKKTDEGVSGNFTKSVITNIEDTLRIVEFLNITDDQTLKEFCHRIKYEICKYSGETLRASEEARKDAMDKANEISKLMKAYL